VESKEARPFGLDLAQSPDGRETDELFAIAPPENAAVHPAPGRYKKYFDNQSLRRRNVPEAAGDKFAGIVDNDFQTVSAEPLSTFSIDVDSASYTKSRQLLLEAGRLPPADAVRIEEFINYFDYEYSGPQGDAPFGADLAVTTCPWQPEHQLVRIALQATKLELSERPKANIVFLLDVSGSMDEPNKLPLVKESIRMLVEQLGENDKIAMAVYAGAAGCVLEGTRGDKQDMILQAIENLQAGGSTNGGQGIQLAYDLARDNFVAGGINRVILCTDGDFNVGVTSTEALVELVEENAKSKIFLTVLGYGMGNTNDAMMEQISNRGNGVYAFVDSRREAHRQMVQQLAGNLMTVAKDVKIQVEFNPQQVQAYRLIGYENRIMAAEDFNNDKKDAGEIGAGHRVTALYEIVPPEAGDDAGRGRVEELRYQPRPEVVAPASPPVAAAHQNELLAVKLRYKQPEGDTSQLLTFPLAVPDADHDLAFAAADRDLQWAAVVAEFGMLLRGSQYRGNATWSSLVERAIEAAGVSPDASRQECLEMMRRAAALSGR
jgi:Ca-activated chloride channel family protein